MTLTQISKTRHYSTLNILETVQATDRVTMKYQWEITHSLHNRVIRMALSDLEWQKNICMCDCFDPLTTKSDLFFKSPCLFTGAYRLAVVRKKYLVFETCWTCWRWSCFEVSKIILKNHALHGSTFVSVAIRKRGCNVNILNMSLVFIFVYVLVLLLPGVFQVEPITFSE